MNPQPLIETVVEKLDVSIYRRHWELANYVPGGVEGAKRDRLVEGFHLPYG
jgi:hypothetical protein